MTLHEFRYLRYLLSELKRLQTESEAKSVMLDSWHTYGPQRVQTNWRTDVEKMAQDPMFRSAVVANLEAYFSRIERGLRDERAFKELLTVRTAPPLDEAPQ